MKTKLLQAYLVAAFILGLFSCSPVAYPVGAPNPLDEPGHVEPTAAELHAENIRIIRGLAR